MTMAGSTSSITRAPRPSSLADVLDLILDKGLVIDAYVRVSAVGIEVLTIDARVVIASVDTYLHFAEAVNRLDLRPTEVEGITGFIGGGDQSGDSQDSSGGGSDNEHSPSNGRRRAGSERPGLVGRLGERGKWE